MNMDEHGLQSLDLLHLTAGEKTNTLQVICDFFDDDRLSGQLERLRSWRDSVLRDDYFRGDKGSPSELLYFQRLNLRLLEALYQLLQADGPHLGGAKNTVAAVFSQHPLPWYREQLEEWLEHGLSSKGAGEFITSASLITVYENLIQLYHAAAGIQESIAAKNIESKNQILTPMKTVSLYQPDPSVDQHNTETISRVVSSIRHKVPLTRIIFYLGASPQPDLRLFFLVVTSDEERRQAQEISQQVEETCRPLGSITVIAMHAHLALSRSQDASSFFSRSLTCPVVFLSGELLPTALFPHRLAERTPDDRATVCWQRWQGQARDFLKGAGYYLNEGMAEPALFSLHQAAECALCGIIKVVSGHQGGSHNLATLLKLTQLFTGDLKAVFDLNTPEGVQAFDLLKGAYVNVRYKDGYEVSIEPVKSLYMVVERCLTATQALYKRFMLISSI
ncbi:HEPN domain-containing protein [Mucilaginibacter robiniae]|nr:HEPN domain-containing protein [Mucilaginibacter robiniae]